MNNHWNGGLPITVIEKLLFPEFVVRNVQRVTRISQKKTDLQVKITTPQHVLPKHKNEAGQTAQHIIK